MSAFIRFYDVSSDELVQCEIPEATVRAARESGVRAEDIQEERFPKLREVSRLRSQRR